MSTSYHWHLKIYFGLGYIWHFKSNFFWYKRGAIFPTWAIMIEFYKLIILVLSRISHTQKDKSTFRSKYNYIFCMIGIYILFYSKTYPFIGPHPNDRWVLNICSASIESSTLKVKLFLHVWGRGLGMYIKKCKKKVVALSNWDYT